VPTQNPSSYTSLEFFSSISKQIVACVYVYGQDLSIFSSFICVVRL
jgi:hypothetical protein